MWILMLMFSQAASANPIDVTFCAEVDIVYTDADFGDRWTDDTVDVPARGFEYLVMDTSVSPEVQVFPDPTTGEEPYAYDGTQNVGCIRTLNLDPAKTYDVTITSHAKVDTNTIMALDDPDPALQNPATALVLDDWSPPSAGTYTFVLDGTTDPRWNHLALAAFALYMHNGQLTGTGFRIYEDSCCSASGGKIHLKGTKRKSIAGHEIGHAVSHKRNLDGPGFDFDYGADLEGCKSDGSTGQHGQLTKEYQSAAAVEGIADFYSALTWNTHGANDDCEYRRQYGLDWNSDGTPDVTSVDNHMCHGDPYNDVPDPLDDKDWLEDLIALDDDDDDLVQCEGTPTNRSTQYDWVRYLWSMVTVQAVPVTHLWEIWDDADPHTWNATDAGDTGDFPIERWEAAADSNGYATEHDNEMGHGLDH